MTGLIRSRRTGKISIRQPSRASKAIAATLVVLLSLTVVGFVTVDTKGTNLREATAKAFRDFRIMLTEPRLVHFGLSEAMSGLAVTIGLAVLTTVVGAAAALVVGLLAAQNLTSRRISNVIKAVVAAVRAVPTVLWVLIFAIGAGLGSVAAVLGMSFHSFGYLLKAYSESFEELDEGALEALKASGASWLQTVFQAVIPSSATYLLSWTFIRFEINFVTAVAMGAAAGAGGIGFDLYMAGGRYFNIREVGLITYLILGVAVVLEILATRIKARYRLEM